MDSFINLKIQPLFDYCVLASILGFILFIGFGIDAYGTVSVSRMIANSEYGIGISLLIVFIHAISVMIYLLIVSKYIKKDVRCGCIRFDLAQYNIIVALCAGYLFFLLLAIFIKVDNDTDAHNVFVVVSVILAILSSWIHRHAFSERVEKNEQYLWASEFTTALIISVLALLFFVLEENILEYVLLTLLLMDKKFKLVTLTQTGLLNAFNLSVNVTIVENESSAKVLPQSSIF